MLQCRGLQEQSKLWPNVNIFTAYECKNSRDEMQKRVHYEPCLGCQVVRVAFLNKIISSKHIYMINPLYWAKIIVFFRKSCLHLWIRMRVPLKRGTSRRALNKFKVNTKLFILLQWVNIASIQHQLFTVTFGLYLPIYNTNLHLLYLCDIKGFYFLTLSK